MLGIREAVEAGGSRCGICNGAEWRTLSAAQLRGQVPEAVRAEEGEFYQCGVCLQVFWPGAKYESTMDGLKQATLEEAGREQVEATYTVIESDEFVVCGPPVAPARRDQV